MESTTETSTEKTTTTEEKPVSGFELKNSQHFPII
jgi:hypothetical protein